ncbi:MAG: hypothetical protein MJ069_09955 [Salinivirgaceae bacterium]|nr:hypothetical protein [Salinivirgaceae bacterium]
MKKFDLEAAQNGEPICTRDGRPARFLGELLGKNNSIVAAVEFTTGEEVFTYYHDGAFDKYSIDENDLFMCEEIPAVITGYTNIFRYSNKIYLDRRIYDSEFSAIQNGKISKNYVTTVFVTSQYREPIADETINKLY